MLALDVPSSGADQALAATAVIRCRLRHRGDRHADIADAVAQLHMQHNRALAVRLRDNSKWTREPKMRSGATPPK